MTQRARSIAQRLRSAWATHSATPQSGPQLSGRHATTSTTSKGAEFADRLRAAVADRH